MIVAMLEQTCADVLPFNFWQQKQAVFDKLAHSSGPAGSTCITGICQKNLLCIRFLSSGKINHMDKSLKKKT